MRDRLDPVSSQPVTCNGQCQYPLQNKYDPKSDITEYYSDNQYTCGEL